METLTECPVCNSKNNIPFINCKDFTVSQKVFVIVECKDCGFKFTNPRPSENEIGSYYQSEDYISHSNTKKGVINLLYQTVRKYTLKQKINLINSLVNSKGNLLDVGCGTGEFLQACQENGWETLGIEPGESARSYGINTYYLNIKEEPVLEKLGANSFEIITLWHVLEHVPKLNERITELKKLIKPNGSIIIAVPNCTSLDAEMYREYWAAYDVPRHLYHFTPITIEKLFAKHGLKLQKTLPMKFDSFYVSMLSEKYLQADKQNKKGKTNLLPALWNGFQSNLAAKKTNNSFSSQIYIFKK